MYTHIHTNVFNKNHKNIILKMFGRQKSALQYFQFNIWPNPESECNTKISTLLSYPNKIRIFKPHPCKDIYYPPSEVFWVLRNAYPVAVRGTVSTTSWGCAICLTQIKIYDERNRWKKLQRISYIIRYWRISFIPLSQFCSHQTIVSSILQQMFLKKFVDHTSNLNFEGHIRNLLSTQPIETSKDRYLWVW